MKTDKDKIKEEVKTESILLNDFDLREIKEKGFVEYRELVIFSKKSYEKTRQETIQELYDEKMTHLKDIKECQRGSIAIGRWIWVDAVIRRLEKETKELKKKFGGNAK